MVSKRWVVGDVFGHFLIRVEFNLAEAEALGFAFCKLDQFRSMTNALKLRIHRDVFDVHMIIVRIEYNEACDLGLGFPRLETAVTLPWSERPGNPT